MPDYMDTIANCEACDSPMDISAVAPFTSVACPSCGHHARVKTRFGPYTLTQCYAVGGMSMVFTAEDSTLNREVAVKILSENYSQDEKRIKAFEEEARITASFSHPNVVSVLRTGYAFGRFYIAMELVPGGHFEHHIRSRKRIPEEDLLPIAIEVAQGLKAAKAAGLIHRDVKPGNILLDNDGHAKLVDFGLSLVTQGGTAKAEELWATPFYVPPETVEGKEEDFRSDLYALGSTLYHALAGTPPCNEESMATDRLLKAKQEVVPLKEAAPDVSDETCEIVTQAMAYLPDQRFKSYDDMIHDLRMAEKSLRQKKHLQITQAHSLPQSSRSRKLLWSMISAAVVIIMLIFIAPKFSGNSGGKGSSTDNNGDNGGGSSSNNSDDQEAISRDFRLAREALQGGEYEQAGDLFAKLHSNRHFQEPSRSWAGIESVLCAYLHGDSRKARQQAKHSIKHLKEVDDEATDTIGDHIPKLLSSLDSFPPLESKLPEQSASQNVISGMLVGLKNWEQGMLKEAVESFKQVASANLSADEQWVATYQRLATDYLADYSILTGPLFSTKPVDLSRCEKLVEDLETQVDSLKTKGRARYNLRAWQLDLAKHANELRQSEAD